VRINHLILLFGKTKDDVGELLVVEHEFHIRHVGVRPLAPPYVGTINGDIVEAVVVDVASSKDVELAIMLRVRAEMARLKPLTLGLRPPTTLY
jgi:hypothetical protein